MTDELDVDALSRRYGPMVLRRCRRLLGDDDDALDACQEVFLRVVERRTVSPWIIHRASYVDSASIRDVAVEGARLDRVLDRVFDPKKLGVDVRVVPAVRAYR